MIRRISLRVSGRVQGVNFRHLTRLLALQRKLVGWIRNEPDGTVLMEVEGERSELQHLYDWVLGSPANTKVEDCKMDWLTPKFDENTFRILS